MEARCVIVGCGYTGRRLARRLVDRRPVAALVRSDRGAAQLAADGIAVLRGDLDAEADATSAAAIAAAVDGALLAWLAPPPETGEDDARLARFLAALGDARPARLLYLSTTGVYGDAGGGRVDEDTPVAPATPRARRRVAAERTATAWCTAGGVRLVVLRVPGIYGPGRLPLERLARGEPALRPEDAGPGNRIHVDDLVDACLAALERDVRGVFNVGDGDPASTTAFLQSTAALAGLAPPPLVPLAEAAGRIAPGMLSFLVESRQVDVRRMREVLGVELRYGRHEAGIAASLAERRPEG
jgi:nucleoside-diphosphate-sugar epimerase